MKKIASYVVALSAAALLAAAPGVSLRRTC